MQVMLVDAVKVHKLKQRAAKCLIQNCHDTHLAGQTIKEILAYLDLWEGGADETADKTYQGAEKHHRGIRV